MTNQRILPQTTCLLKCFFFRKLRSLHRVTDVTQSLEFCLPEVEFCAAFFRDWRNFGRMMNRGEKV